MRGALGLAVAFVLYAGSVLPAAAAPFWDFSFSGTFGLGSGSPASVGGINIAGTYTISGQTDASGGFSLPSLSMSYSGSAADPTFSPFPEGQTFRSGNAVRTFTPFAFDISSSGDIEWPSGLANGIGFTANFDGSEVFFVANRFGSSDPRLRATTMTEDGTGTPLGVTPDFRNTAAVSTTVAGAATPVPEINGSGFAYIAFILGSLGLWLYGGRGMGGAGSRHSRAQEAGLPGRRATAA